LLAISGLSSRASIYSWQKTSAYSTSLLEQEESQLSRRLAKAHFLELARPRFPIDGESVSEITDKLVGLAQMAEASPSEHISSWPASPGREHYHNKHAMPEMLDLWRQPNDRAC